MSGSPEADGRLVAARYRLEGPLGRGGMGSVWRARDLRNGRAVAVKLVETEGRDARLAMRRFMREAETIAAIEDDHVVRLFDFGVEGDTPFMVMELLDGETLEDLLAREGRLAPPRFATIFTAIARGVDAAHRARLVHRDLKPSNVFLARDASGAERVKVLDFGIVKRREAAGDTATLTQTGVIVGTPYYMSPEQAHGHRDLDHRSDLWSLAVIAFRALTGALPFRGTLTSLLVAICVEPISVAWMLQVMSRNARPSSVSAATCASVSPRGSASLAAISLRRGRRAMFASDVITAITMSSPSVLLPSVCICTRGESRSSSAKYERIWR